jgi:hypothetical protein
VSFLADPPLLVLTGAAIERLCDDKDRARQLQWATTALFVGISVGLYLDASPLRWFWLLLGARSGRDWMVNSGVLRLDVEHLGWRSHLAAALLFATYPLWPRLGRRLAAR